MAKAIKNELNRCANEEEDLWALDWAAFDEACDWKMPGEYLHQLTRNAHRIFYLLVAEAL